MLPSTVDRVPEHTAERVNERIRSQMEERVARIADAGALVVGGFLLQHAVQGWCPPLPIFRRGGVRTQAEIEQERYALKAIRGDFEQMREGNPGRANRALHAVNG